MADGSLRSFQTRYGDIAAGVVDRVVFWSWVWREPLALFVFGLLGVWLGFPANDWKAVGALILGVTLLVYSSVRWFMDYFSYRLRADFAKIDFDASSKLRLGAGPYADWRIIGNGAGSVLVNDALNDGLDHHANTVVLTPGKFSVDADLIRYAPLVFAEMGLRTTNQRKVRLETDLDASLIGDGHPICLQQTDYFSDRLTNHLSQREIFVGGEREFDGTTLFASEAGSMIPLAQSRCSNQLGGSTLLLTRDGTLCYMRQGRDTAESTGKLAPAGSGSFDFKPWAEELRARSISFQDFCRSEIERELAEEIGAEVGPSASKTMLIGFARFLYRGGKPEIFGLTLTRSKRFALRVRPQEWGYMNLKVREVPLAGGVFSDDALRTAADELLRICEQSTECSVPLYVNAVLLRRYLANVGGAAIRDFFGSIG